MQGLDCLTRFRCFFCVGVTVTVTVGFEISHAVGSQLKRCKRKTTREERDFCLWWKRLQGSERNDLPVVKDGYFLHLLLLLVSKDPSDSFPVLCLRCRRDSQSFFFCLLLSAIRSLTTSNIQHTAWTEMSWVTSTSVPSPKRMLGCIDVRLETRQEPSIMRRRSSSPVRHSLSLWET